MKLDIEAFINWRPEYKDLPFCTKKKMALFKLVVGKVEKMYEIQVMWVSPDAICKKNTVRTVLRLYECFLGPLAI